MVNNNNTMYLDAELLALVLLLPENVLLVFILTARALIVVVVTKTRTLWFEPTSN